jgi:hypothetical protein
MHSAAASGLHCSTAAITREGMSAWKAGRQQGQSARAIMLCCLLPSDASAMFWLDLQEHAAVARTSSLECPHEPSCVHTISHVRWPMHHVLVVIVCLDVWIACLSVLR